MKNHDFIPDPLNHEVCDLCGHEADSSIHEMDGEPPENDGAPDVPANFPPTPAALFHAAGIRNPPGT